MTHDAPAPPALIEDYVRHLESGGALTPEEFLEGAGVDDLEALESLRLAALLEREAPRGPAPGELLGPYRLERRLGTGGMGTVYLATVAGRAANVSEGTSVALKLVHPHLFQKTGYFSRFLREVEVGRRVKHDNVVRVLAADAIESTGRMHHVLVMEYVEGRTLRELLKDLGTVPEALLREIAAQVTEGLAAVHAAGVVHRDLKPENVLITDDHRVRIMDLGVARVVAETASLTREGEFIGSLAYAAPEQFQAQEVTAAADLYSLGVLLYELATGGNPFQRDEIPQLIAAHLNEIPRRADDVNDELSAFLAELLATLLAKDPADRFDSAGSLGDVLGLAERSPWWAEREHVLRRGGTHVPRIPVQRQTQLHGREQDLAMLRDAWERARLGKGNSVLLEGEAGIGKTRLVDAFLHDLGDADSSVLYGSYPPAGGIGGLSDAVIEYFGAAGLAEALAPYLSVMPSLVPAFAALLRHEPAPSGAEAIQGDALHAVFVHLMRGLADEKPLIWVVDDLHFAGADSRSVLLALARAVEGYPVLLLLTTRPGLPQTELAHFSRLESFRRAGVARLSAREVIEVLRDALRSERLAERIGGTIAYKSDGVPFFVFEMIRGLKEGQFITELPDGTWVETRVIDRIEVPSAVRDLIEARLRDLTEEQRAILDVGAVQGFSFDPDLVARVIELPRVKVLRSLAEVERRWGIVRGEAGEVRFDHHQIQEVLYEHLPPDLRKEYHALVAASLELREDTAAAEPSGVAGEVRVALCHHYLAGERGDRAHRYLDGALQHLEQGCLNADAVALAESALGAPSLITGAERVGLLLRMAERLDLLGSREVERAALDEALALAEKGAWPGLRARAETSLGWYLQRVALYRAADEVLRRALRRAREADDRRIEGMAAGNLGVVCKARGRYAEAREYLEHHLALSRESGNRLGEAAARGNLGNLSIDQGRFAEAREHLERQLVLSQAIGDRSGEARATGNLGIVLQREGRYAEAREHFERHIAFGREIGDREAEATATGNLGNVLLHLCEFEQARAHFERGAALAREIDDRQRETNSLGNLGLVLAVQGRYADARVHHERQLALAREIGDRMREGFAAGCLGFVSTRQGRFEDALGQFDRQLASAREIGNPFGQAFGLLGSGELLTLLGRPDAGRERLSASLAICREIGARDLEDYVLHGLGAAEESLGAAPAAECRYREALALRRELDYPGGIATTLLALGALHASVGRTEEARAALTESGDLAQRLGVPGLQVLSRCHLALLPGGDVGAARTALDELRERLAVGERLQARFLLWRATEDPRDLAKACHHLEQLRDHAPEEYRGPLVQRVPLHREVAGASERFQTSGG